jgi:hypothetical protein
MLAVAAIVHPYVRMYGFDDIVVSVSLLDRWVPSDIHDMTFDSPLDPGVVGAVTALVAAGIETFESCQGGPGHAYPEPTVRFHGDIAEGHRALAAAMRAGLPVSELRRVWPVIDSEPTGPWWELTFRSTDHDGGARV